MRLVEEIKTRFVLGALACTALVYPASAQTVATPVTPVGDEAYRVLAQFFDYDEEIPLDVRIVEKTEEPSYVREKIVFRGVRDSHVPGYLAIPKTGTPPYPVVLQLHGLGGSKANWWDDEGFSRGGQVTQGLLGAGYAVLALDAQYHGERLVNNGYEPPGVMVFERGWLHRYRDLLVQSVVEYRRALDYLATREEIDADRVGMIGYSMGGHMTFILTGIDPRIDVSVACVTPSMTERMTGVRMKENASFVIAPHEFARAVDSRPLLMLMGRSDQAYSVSEAEQLRDLIDGSSKKLIWYESGHRLPDEYIADALDWFQRHLSN